MHPRARTVSGRKDISLFFVSTCSTFEFTMSNENKKRYGRIFANLACEGGFEVTRLTPARTTYKCNFRVNQNTIKQQIYMYLKWDKSNPAIELIYSGNKAENKFVPPYEVHHE